MITLTDYGVKLVQLSQNKIELVRKWRNSDKIKKYMEYRDYIRSWTMAVAVNIHMHCLI